mmetsp:Transcript_21336/g.49668  ORF Transcript_21336/g.49668 Transcript_21336/m.49668 type:complete len:106 (+) Transcript_21336:823-1140(+)
MTAKQKSDWSRLAGAAVVVTVDVVEDVELVVVVVVVLVLVVVVPVGANVVAASVGCLTVVEVVDDEEVLDVEVLDVKEDVTTVEAATAMGGACWPATMGVVAATV